MQISDGMGKLILVVDDEPLIVSYIQRTLADGGYSVLTANDGAACLKLVQEKKPDLILLDIKMPGEDGIFTLGKIRDITPNPVIMVTGLGSDTMVEKAMGMGADDYIRKPFRPKELLARVKAKLRRG